MILVDENSGCLDINPSIDKHPLSRNHFDIHKFGKPDEQGFRIVSSVIRTMAKEGPRRVKSRTECM